VQNGLYELCLTSFGSSWVRKRMFNYLNLSSKFELCTVGCELKKIFSQLRIARICAFPIRASTWSFSVNPMIFSVWGSCHVLHYFFAWGEFGFVWILYCHVSCNAVPSCLTVLIKSRFVGLPYIYYLKLCISNSLMLISLIVLIAWHFYVPVCLHGLVILFVQHQHVCLLSVEMGEGMSAIFLVQTFIIQIPWIYKVLEYTRSIVKFNFSLESPKTVETLVQRRGVRLLVETGGASILLFMRFQITKTVEVWWLKRTWILYCHDSPTMIVLYLSDFLYVQHFSILNILYVQHFSILNISYMLFFHVARAMDQGYLIGRESIWSEEEQQGGWGRRLSSSVAGRPGRPSFDRRTALCIAWHRSRTAI
jgi:hypothetical protein